MRQTSINKAKKLIWQDLQGLVGDLDFWVQTIDDGDWSPEAFGKALVSVYWQLEKKV